MDYEYIIRCWERKFSLPDFDEVEHNNYYYCDHGFKNKKLTKSQKSWDAALRQSTIPEKINFVVSSPDIADARTFKNRELAETFKDTIPTQIQEGHKFYSEFSYYTEVKGEIKNG
tara:strand:- start:1681 stop:2025 length:345 start_codon:yes stop_codon:yes gene_type:complete